MRGLICYYSGTGNTKLACEVIAQKIASIEFELFDIVHDGLPNCATYDLIGFAAWADYFNPPKRMKTFLASLPAQDRTPAFVFNTFGSTPGKTLPSMDRWARNRGFHVIAGHSLHTPENYPPLIKHGMTAENSPSTRELARFSEFILQLDRLAQLLADGRPVPARKAGLLRLLPSLPRTLSRTFMGKKYVNTNACTECGICRERCPYGAITLAPKPEFDQGKCYGCWACYNLCPTQAISTRKIKGVPQYAHPNLQLREKLLGSANGGSS
ncbi:EFR1 family ferrodoxin [Candidatus Bipolaricaulota bacterium]|nr:EFR1 family ferrodoxin [Candidatus Bipolaricaulota bacterium]